MKYKIIVFLIIASIIILGYTFKENITTKESVAISNANNYKFDLDEQRTYANYTNGFSVNNDSINTTTERYYYPKEVNRDPSLVKIKIDENSITKEKVELTIIDENSEPYTWNNSYILEKKVDNEWIKVPYVNPMIVYQEEKIQEGNMFRTTANIKYYFGDIIDGTYRIGKIPYSEETVFYSSEFEMK